MMCNVPAAERLKHYRNILITSPLFYLLAFGYGLGGGPIEEHVPQIAFIILDIVALTALSVSFSSTSTGIMCKDLISYGYH